MRCVMSDDPYPNIPVSMTLTEWEWIAKNLLIFPDDKHCEEKVSAVTKLTLKLSVIKSAVSPDV